ncbi:MAG: ATP-binding protein [Chloroflexia bacterium]|nr:ATP-binding protein [Chloroflexia bacterium]
MQTRVDCDAFALVAAIDLSPCGFFGDPRRACISAVSAVSRYQRKLSLGYQVREADGTAMLSRLRSRVRGGSIQHLLSGERDRRRNSQEVTRTRWDPRPMLVVALPTRRPHPRIDAGMGLAPVRTSPSGRGPRPLLGWIRLGFVPPESLAGR